MTAKYEKHYESDWAKAKSRELVKNMIQRTLLKFRRPKSLRVLCFPGIDAAEIYQVYDPLEIPRQNIFGIEREKNIANELERKNLGIQVINRTLEDYVVEQKELDFDIVSLDYTGPVSLKQLKTLGEIKRKNIRNNLVLHCVNLMWRDDNALYLYLAGDASSLRSEAREIARNAFYNLNHLRIEDRIEEVKGLMKNGERTQSIKAGSHSRIILSEVNPGLRAKNLDYLLKFVSGDNYISQVGILDRYLREHLKINLELNLSNPIEQMQSAIGGYPPLYELVNELIVSSIALFCKKHKLEPKLDITAAIDYSLHCSQQPDKFFNPLEILNYTYVSETGAPMTGNLMYLVYPKFLRSSALNICREVGFPVNFSVRNEDRFYSALKELNRQIRKIYDEKSPISIYENSGKLFLGNASKPVLTKKRFVEELEAGRSTEEIQQKYRGWQNKPLPQWKAHYTMGTYKVREMAEESSEDSDLEKITKEQAIDLISSGIPPEEIYEAWPTSFSIGQLRAYKAHISMGTYKERLNGGEQLK